MTEKLDVYSRVTGKIIADLERGNLTCYFAMVGPDDGGPARRTQISGQALN